MWDRAVTCMHAHAPCTGSHMVARPDLGVMQEHVVMHPKGLCFGNIIFSIIKPWRRALETPIGSHCCCDTHCRHRLAVARRICRHRWRCPGCQLKT